MPADHFIASPSSFLESLRRASEIASTGSIVTLGIVPMKQLIQFLGTEVFENRLEAVYEELESISFDYGIMEKTTDPVFVVPCDCGWSDVGSWESVYELREEERDKDENLAEGDCVLIDCGKSFVSSKGGRMVTCLGLKDCLVVDTPDALLVADIRKSQDVRRIKEQLKRKLRKDLL
jgi:mannose-1-phosphate guanylyltransferase